MTISDPAAASRGDAAAIAPEATKGWVFCGVRLYTMKRQPEAWTLRAMPAPMRPSPMQATDNGNGEIIASLHSNQSV